MAYRKIFITEQRLKKDILLNQEKLETLNLIREYMERIDYTVEVITRSDSSSMQSLLTELKGTPLSVNELMMIREINNE